MSGDLITSLLLKQKLLHCRYYGIWGIIIPSWLGNEDLWLPGQVIDCFVCSLGTFISH